MNSSEKIVFYRGMFELEASYLHHRLRREPWWGMDYAFGNFTRFKIIPNFAPGLRMDLDEIPWRQLLVECWNKFQLYNAAADREKYVEFLWQIWGERWLKGFSLYEAEQRSRPRFGCFNYNFHPEDNSIALHFLNMEAPNSPFSCLEKRKDDLREIIKDVETKGLQPSKVHFQSWLNNLKSIQSLFPDSFNKSFVTYEEFPKGNAWWGQFITKEGKINSRRAELLKQQGKFELNRLDGSVSWIDFKNHL
jgi:hypothetical protein